MQVLKRGLTGVAATLLRGLGRGAQLPRPPCGQVRRRSGERRHWTGRRCPTRERGRDMCPPSRDPAQGNRVPEPRSHSTVRSPNRPASRPGHASSNASPVSSVKTSIRPGGTPIWKTSPGIEKSLSVTSAIGAPKVVSALTTRGALAGVAPPRHRGRRSREAARDEPAHRRRRRGSGRQRR